MTPVLTFMVYRLALHPTNFQIIRDELKSIPNTQDSQELQKLSHLNAFIHEVMRVHPPILDGLQRNTPSEGVIISEQYIPGNVTCLAPFHTIARRECQTHYLISRFKLKNGFTVESCFEDAEEFIPERWTTAPHLTKDKSAHMPFSLGPYGCVGKNLALVFLRLTTAFLVHNYDIGFAPGEMKSTIIDESNNTVTNNPGPLKLIFKKRRHQTEFGDGVDVNDGHGLC
ncbi:uncharacterized protein KY384_002414 [Bacidia gigantensis]|uniref:uncharacterized protein n=1 Tax=Bacidia gigantensis TaxID=2732470 RepID=UPI001D04E99B|nr:uncharacterized protein KY384_002414 [Bacidia gigantensis]KAG8532537.1 hypothetical protein KY384_002414 [Bacidia gigantensis]